jgi:hypothetical protein
LGYREQGRGWREEEWIRSWTQEHEDLIAKRRPEGWSGFSVEVQGLALRGGTQGSCNPAPESGWQKEYGIDPEARQRHS